MRKTLIRLLLALPIGALAGCAAEAPVATASQALGGFTFDSRAIATPPPTALPDSPLPRSAFDDAEITRSLIQTTETFAPGERSGDVTEMDSSSWMFQKLQPRGLLLVQRTVDPGPAAPQDDAAMQRLALGRLAAWGVPSQEIGRVLQRRGMLQDADDSTGVTSAEVHRYKTFVFRAINGVPIEGHKATLSHATDGAFHRALINWPPLAGGGHKLTTRLSVSEIEQRAARALTGEGETDGAVKLRWKYTAEPTTTGETVLTLKVAARMGAVHNREYTEEPREVTVVVDAL